MDKPAGPVRGLEMRDMAPSEAEVAIGLARAQGWRDRRRFYDFVFRVPTCQPVVALADGRVVGTGLATAQGSVGWLGAIAVEAAWRRLGIGRAITEELCRRLRAAGCTTLSLEATDDGRPMYERMGFRLAATYHQLQAGHLPDAPVAPAGARVRRLEPADLPAICELDRLATCEDRSVALAVMAGDGRGRVMARDGAVCGFLVPAERAYGPVIAPRFEDGLFLLDLHRHVIPTGADVRAGIPDPHAAAWRELRSRGWNETWQAPRLILGPDVPWRPDWIWGQMNSAMG
jgi:ribosomal protein S18 acetylase RimI-like enzyme